jgi:hypothetical protein
MINTLRNTARTAGVWLARIVWMCVVLAGATSVHGQVVYRTDFDSLTPGLTQVAPGAPGHDGWYLALAAAPAYGEIQSTVANPGNALHEFTGIANVTGQQTIDMRLLTPPDLSTNPIIIFEADFLASTSDLQAINPYSASMEAKGGPHPGFYIIGFALAAGNGAAKQSTGVSVAIGCFNGVDNNVPIPLTVGQQLAWDTWHQIRIIGDQASEHYVSVTVDGQTQDISAYLMAKSDSGGGIWVRGQLIELMSAQIIPNDVLGDETDDDVYWDNITLMASFFADGFESGDLSAWSASVP